MHMHTHAHTRTHTGTRRCTRAQRRVRTVDGSFSGAPYASLPLACPSCPAAASSGAAVPLPWGDGADGTGLALGPWRPLLGVGVLRLGLSPHQLGLQENT